MAMPPARTRSDRPPDRTKATLICQDCGRERHVDDGWERRRDDDRVAIVCPACEHVLTRRPSASGGAGSRLRERLVPTLAALAVAPRAAQQWLTVPGATTLRGRVGRLGRLGRVARTGWLDRLGRTGRFGLRDRLGVRGSLRDRLSLRTLLPGRD